MAKKSKSDNTLLWLSLGLGVAYFISKVKKTTASPTPDPVDYSGGITENPTLVDEPFIPDTKGNEIKFER